MLNLIGIPLDLNSSFLRGPAYAPARIRQMEKDGSANIFSEEGIAIAENQVFTDLGDIKFTGSNPVDAFNLIRETIKEHTAGNKKIICLGGDHSITYPIIEGLTGQYTDLHILHFDAHTDLYENFEDNPYSHASPFARIMETGKIKSLTQVGIRTLTTEQRAQSARYGIRTIEMKNINFDFIQHLPSPLYISLDLDVLDPAYAPGVSHHEPGGLSTRQLLTMIQMIKVKIIGADIVEYNPMRDVNNMTAMVAYKFFKEIASKMTEQFG